MYKEVSCKMLVININSGLGNQMFHYAFYLRLIRENPTETVLLEKSIYKCADMESKYQIEQIFNVHPRYVSDLLNQDENEIILEHGTSVMNKMPHNWLSKGAVVCADTICSQLTHHVQGEWKKYTDVVSHQEKDFKYDIKLVLKRCPIVADIFYKIKPQEKRYNMREFYTAASRMLNIDNLRLNDENYIRDIVKAPKSENRYYIGNFEAGSKYFESVADEVRQVFTFPALDERNGKIAKQMTECESVAIHLRRGDHLLSNNVLFQKGGYYDRAVTRIKELVITPTFYLFSDDLKWCRENYMELGLTSTDKIVFVDGNTDLDSYKDMQLMSLCHHNIIPISTFSWWASYLNQYPDKIIIAPKGYWCDASIYL